jgi:twitching motility protein PilT
VAEALQRMVLAFPAEIQAGVSAQLADALRAVVCQRLRHRPDLDLRLPECQILVANSAARACIRGQQFFKLASVMETGAADGMWTWERYRTWLDKKTDFMRPEETTPEAAEPEPKATEKRPSTRPKLRKVTSPPEASEDRVLVIKPPKGELSDILAELESTEPKKAQ